jgi:hypothetical protein
LAVGIRVHFIRLLHDKMPELAIIFGMHSLAHI